MGVPPPQQLQMPPPPPAGPPPPQNQLFQAGQPQTQLAAPTPAPAAPVVVADIFSTPPPKTNGTHPSNGAPPTASANPVPSPPAASPSPSAATTATAVSNQTLPAQAQARGVPLPQEVAAELHRFRRDKVNNPDLPEVLKFDETRELRRLLPLTKLIRFSSKPQERGGIGTVTEAQMSIWPVRFHFVFDEQGGVVWKCSLTAELIVEDKTKRSKPIPIIDRDAPNYQLPARLYRDNLVTAGRWVNAAPLSQDTFLHYLLFICMIGAADGEQLVVTLLKYIRTQIPPRSEEDGDDS